MQVTYEIQAEDYLAFNLYYLKNSEGMKKRVRMSQWMGAAIILAVGVVFCVLRGFSWLPAALFVAVAALYMVYIPFSVKNGVRKNVVRVLKTGSKNACGKKTLALEADGLRLTGMGENSYYAYGSVQRIAEDDQHEYIYTGALEALILPLRAFDNAAARTAFMEALQSSVAKAEPIVAPEGDAE